MNLDRLNLPHPERKPFYEKYITHMRYLYEGQKEEPAKYPYPLEEKLSMAFSVLSGVKDVSKIKFTGYPVFRKAEYEDDKYYSIESIKTEIRIEKNLFNDEAFYVMQKKHVKQIINLINDSSECYIMELFSNKAIIDTSYTTCLMPEIILAYLTRMYVEKKDSALKLFEQQGL